MGHLKFIVHKAIFISLIIWNLFGLYVLLLLAYYYLTTSATTGVAGFPHDAGIWAYGNTLALTFLLLTSQGKIPNTTDRSSL